MACFTLNRFLSGDEGAPRSIASWLAFIFVGAGGTPRVRHLI
jgi:hypothetical protein